MADAATTTGSEPEPSAVGRPDLVESLVALTVVGFLAAVSLGAVPPLAYHWGLNLWSYLPSGWVAALASLAVGVSIGPLRRWLGARLQPLWREAAELPPRLSAVLLFAIAVGLLFQFRERAMYGDSLLILLWGIGDFAFVVPDLGATFLTGRLLRLAVAIGVDPALLFQSASVLLGGVTLLLVRAGMARLWPGHVATAVVLVAGTGLMRVFAGHIEVYAVQLPAVVAYLWAALARVDGRAPWWLPCLALGFAIWVHLSVVLLLPSLLALAWLVRDEAGPASFLAQATRHVAVAAVPGLVFFAGLGVTGDLLPAIEAQLPKVMQILGLGPEAVEEGGKRWWVRGWGGEPSIGTDVVFLSPAHLKYLFNAAFLLAPVTLPLALWGLARRGRLAWADPKARFLLAVAAPLVLYPMVLRPFWGPYDWDLFSISAVAIGFVAVRLLALWPEADRRSGRLAWAIAVQLAFVGIPFLVMNALDLVPAGPFASFRMLTIDIVEPLARPNPDIAPWL